MKHKATKTTKAALFTAILAGLMFFAVSCFGQDAITFNQKPAWVAIKEACDRAFNDVDKVAAQYGGGPNSLTLEWACGSKREPDAKRSAFLWSGELDEAVYYDPDSVKHDTLVNLGELLPFRNVVKFGPHKYYLLWGLDFTGDTYFYCDPKADITIFEPININAANVVSGNGCVFHVKLAGGYDHDLVVGQTIETDPSPVEWVKEPLTRLVPKCAEGYEPWKHVPAYTPPPPFTNAVAATASYSVPQSVSAHDVPVLKDFQYEPSNVFCAPVGYNPAPPVYTPVFNYGTLTNGTTIPATTDGWSTSFPATTLPLTIQEPK